MSLAFVTGIIARRFGYTAANAAAIAESLSAEDRELVELATRHPEASAQIAAIIMAARTRAADRLPPADRARALALAAQEAARHYRTIKLEDPGRLDPAASPPLRRGHRLRVVPTPKADLPGETE